MHSEEFIDLRNKFFLGILVAIIISLPLIVLFAKNANRTRSNVISGINRGETFTTFVVDSDNCNNCKEVEKILKNKKIEYRKYDLATSNWNSELTKILDISLEEIKAPGLFYVRDGDIVVSIFDIKTVEEIDSYISYLEMDE